MRRFTGMHLGWTSLLTATLLCGCESPAPPKETQAQSGAPNSAMPAASIDHRERVNSGRVYVPTHSHIYTRDGQPEDLAMTLSIHNVSIERELVVDEVKYYDTDGKLLQEYLTEPVVLAPLRTAEYFVPVKDQRGGSGANFVVGWHADSPVVRPLVDAVMVHTQGPQAYAFTSRGVEIRMDADLPAEASTNTEAPKPEAPKPEPAATETGETEGVPSADPQAPQPPTDGS